MDKLTKFLGVFVALIGLVVLIPFVPSVLNAQSHVPVGLDHPLVAYALATAGSSLLAWAWMLFRTTPGGVSKRDVLLASALGLYLLAGVRAFSFFVPFAPLTELTTLLVAEILLFFALAVLCTVTARNAMGR